MRFEEDIFSTPCFEMEGSQREIIIGYELKIRHSSFTRDAFASIKIHHVKDAVT
jgi:hypothetical protein